MREFPRLLELLHSPVVEVPITMRRKDGAWGYAAVASAAEKR
jgi:hypothetical protein